MNLKIGDYVYSVYDPNVIYKILYVGTQFNGNPFYSARIMHSNLNTNLFPSEIKPVSPMEQVLLEIENELCST